MNKQVRYNLHGHMIEYDKNNRTWNWSKWDSIQRNGEQKVIRRGGPLQFQKIFSSVIEGEPEYIPARNSEELEKVLAKQGLDFIFLYQGEATVEDRFKTVEEAEQYHDLHSCPQWTLTDYWFGFNGELNSWAMYDAFTGALRFTPESIMRQRAQNARIMKAQSNNTTH